MFRFISLTIRRIKFSKNEANILKQFTNWKKKPDSFCEQNSLQKLLIVRLDDIGDYIIFRNFLSAYKISARWKNYDITFLGNIVWKELFEVADFDFVDKCIWIDKKQYLNNESYRNSVWINLHEQKFETVICTSRTRPLLLDDLCAVATGAKNKIGSANTTFHTSWNKPSDEIYTEIFHVPDESIHEFYFNKAFAEWCCKLSLDAVKFHFLYVSKLTDPYIICFIGASTKSKQWPLKNWIELIYSATKKYNYKVLIAGAKADEQTANAIASATGAENIAGKTTLCEITNLIGNATLVISNDTMAAHLAAACHTTTIILANGNNYYRFTEYNTAGFKYVFTLYPKHFLKVLKTKYFLYLKQYIAVTKDIHSIMPASVLKSMDTIINDQRQNNKLL